MKEAGSFCVSCGKAIVPVSELTEEDQVAVKEAAALAANETRG